MGTKGQLGKLDIDECDDITQKATQPHPAHRPSDNVQVWKKRVELALAMEELRRAGHTYEEAAAQVAETLHASEASVKRAYGIYVAEPADPNSAERRRKWQRSVRSKDLDRSKNLKKNL